MQERDPVHYIASTDGQIDPEYYPAIGWYFWIETWADVCGPYATENECRSELDRYCREVLGL